MWHENNISEEEYAMKESMGEINKAIRALRRELKDVHGDASVEKQHEVYEILERLNFYVSRKLLFDDKPGVSDTSLILCQLTRSI